MIAYRRIIRQAETRFQLIILDETGFSDQKDENSSDILPNFFVSGMSCAVCFLFVNLS